MINFENWLPSLLTSKELKVLQKRFQLLQLLKTKKTYRKIAKKMGISTTTVVRLNQRLKLRKPKSKKTKPFRKQALKRVKNKLPWKIG